jgi:hypothetical protein
VKRRICARGQSRCDFNERAASAAAETAALIAALSRVLERA